MITPSWMSAPVRTTAPLRITAFDFTETPEPTVAPGSTTASAAMSVPIPMLGWVGGAFGAGRGRANSPANEAAHSADPPRIRKLWREPGPVSIPAETNIPTPPSSPAKGQGFPRRGVAGAAPGRTARERVSCRRFSSSARPGSEAMDLRRRDDFVGEAELLVRARRQIHFEADDPVLAHRGRPRDALRFEHLDLHLGDLGYRNPLLHRDLGRLAAGVGEVEHHLARERLFSGELADFALLRRLA